MKMVLLILVALMLSAQPARDPAFIPGEYLTAGALNGHWSTHATPLERRIYLLAYRDGSQVMVAADSNLYRDFGFDLNLRVKDAIDKMFARQTTTANVVVKPAQGLVEELQSARPRPVDPPSPNVWK
jgi:hypothetical protein